MSKPAFAAVAALLACLASPAADAYQRSASGLGASGVQWQAQSLLVGVTSTATLAALGDPIYQPVLPTSAGMVSLIMNFTGGSFICSGTLMPDRQSVLTAAHCVTDQQLGLPLSTTASFYGGSVGDTVVSQSALSTRVAVSQYFVHPSYTGDVFDQNDIAVLRLADPAPSFAPAFGLYTQDLTGKGFTVWGYGARSDRGGSIGSNLTTGRLRQGDNRFDFRLGDSVFGTGWATEFGEPFEQIEHSWLSDFDSGLAANDAGCLAVGQEFPALGASAQWCDLGRGAREVGLAGGDSGGPGFIDGLVASISSFGVTFSTPAYGDVDTVLNSSFGEFSGYVPVYLHTNFINAALVPEPSTWALMGVGLALAVGAARRRRRLNGPRHAGAGLALATMALVMPLQQAQAQTLVFTDRTSFLAALQPGAYTESFDSGEADFQPSFTFAQAGFAYDISGAAASGVYTNGSFIGNLSADRALVITFTAGSPMAVGGHFFASDVSDSIVPNATVTLQLSNGFSYSFTYGSQAAYLGFIGDAPIASMVFNAPGADRFNAIDNLTVGVVPEPGSGAMLALGMLGLVGWLARRRVGPQEH